MDKKLFGNNGSTLEDNKVYVVLDQLNKEEDKQELKFGLKIVDRNGKQLGASGNNALLVTDNSAGLINVQGFYSIGNPDGRTKLTENFEEILQRQGVDVEFQANASEIDTWLKGGADIEEGKWNSLKGNSQTIGELMKADGTPTGEAEKLFGDWLSKVSAEEKKQKMKSLFNSMWFEKKTGVKIAGMDVTVKAEWVSWCGTVDNKRDKRLGDGRELSNDIGGGYKKASSEVELRVGPIRRSEKEQRWAIVPIGRPIMKINLVGRSLDNEAIEGTLEPMKDSYSLIT